MHPLDWISEVERAMMSLPNTVAEIEPHPDM